MNKTYRPTRKGILINTFVALVFTTALSFLFYHLLASIETLATFVVLGVCVVIVGVILYIIYTSIQFVVEKLTISENALIYKGLSAEKVFPKEEIQGFKKIPFNIDVYSKNNHSKIRISDFYTDKQEIRTWLWDHCQNLDMAEQEEDMKVYEEEMQEILTNEDYGNDSDTAKDNYLQTYKYVKIFNLFAWGITLWYMFSPTFYRLLTALVMVLPIVSLIIIRAKKGLVRLFTNENGAYLNLGVSIGIMAIALPLRATLDVDLASYQVLWVPLIVTSLVGLVLIYYAAWQELKVTKWGESIALFLLLVGAIGAYSYGSIIHINATFDDQPYQVYHMQVIEKKTTGSEDEEEYYIMIEGSLPNSSNNEVRVYEELYEKIKLQDSVSIYIKPGVLKIPWIRYVEKKK
ncbi:hypothetical protein BKI52_08890 [marine bacterium AO1-C]|nr:hypothetical protein BKI52_08890 [marine bacterium AO1-C]